MFPLQQYPMKQESVVGLAPPFCLPNIKPHSFFIKLSAGKNTSHHPLSFHVYIILVDIFVDHLKVPCPVDFYAKENSDSFLLESTLDCSFYGNKKKVVLTAPVTRRVIKMVRMQQYLVIDIIVIVFRQNGGKITENGRN